jgi:hypothetical protein
LANTSGIFAYKFLARSIDMMTSIQNYQFKIKNCCYFSGGTSRDYFNGGTSRRLGAA